MPEAPLTSPGSSSQTHTTPSLIYINTSCCTMDPQLLLFRRQYFQLFEPGFLAWPPKALLRDTGVQRWLYNNLFNADNNPYLPSDRYRFRVLKPLVAKIEQAIEDPEEDVGSMLPASSVSTFSVLEHAFSFMLSLSDWYISSTGDLRRPHVPSLQSHLLRSPFGSRSSAAKILRDVLLCFSYYATARGFR